MNAHILNQNRYSRGRQFVAVFAAISMLAMQPALALSPMSCKGDAAEMDCCCEAAAVKVVESECCDSDELANEAETSEALIGAPSTHRHHPLGARGRCVSENEQHATFTWNGPASTRSLSQASVVWEEHGPRDKPCPSQFGVRTENFRPILYFSSPTYIALASLRR